MGAMTTERWRDIERTFEKAATLDSSERAGFLDRECGGDAELRREVESLLACDSEDDTFAERAVQGTAALLAAGVAEPMAGKRVGPYRITRLVGRGGMGAVYEAVREDGEYEHKVAIKLARRGMETPSDVRRFRRERQTLSRLN